MAPTKKAGKVAKKPSNGGSEKVPAEQGAGLWKMFPVLTVLVGIAVGTLWAPATKEAASGEAKAGSDGEAFHSGSALCLPVVFFVSSREAARNFIGEHVGKMFG